MAQLLLSDAAGGAQLRCRDPEAKGYVFRYGVEPVRLQTAVPFGRERKRDRVAHMLDSS